MDFLKNKIYHQSNLDSIEIDLSERLTKLIIDKGSAKSIRILESHVKAISEARVFLSEVCEEHLKLMNKEI